MFFLGALVSLMGAAAGLVASAAFSSSSWLSLFSVLLSQPMVPGAAGKTISCDVSKFDQLPLGALVDIRL